MLARVLHRVFGSGSLPDDDGALPGERVLFEAEGVSTVKHFSGRVPGLRARGSGREFGVGAFRITNARVLAVMGGQAVVRMGFDQRRDDGPVTVSLGPDGLHAVWDLDRVHPSCHGVLTLHFRSEVPQGLLSELPFTEVRFAAQAQQTVRLAGSLHRLPATG